MEFVGVGDPGVRLEDWVGHGEQNEAGEEENRFEDGEGEGAVACGACLAGLPCEAASGEEDGIDGGKVVVLGVHGHHEGEEDEIREAEPAAGRFFEKPEKTCAPDEKVNWVEGDELCIEEGQWAQDFILVLELAVAEELECGPMVVDLPEEIRDGDEDK